MKVIPQMSVDTRMLYERLKECDVGHTIPYQELSKIIGREVTGKARSVLATARRKAMTTDRMVFACVYKVGVKRLTDVDIVETSEDCVRRVRKASTRAVRRITTVDFAKLPNEAKVKHNTYLSVFGALASFTQSGALKAIEKKIGDSKEALPLAKTLEVFRDRTGAQ